jgi:ATP-dependent Lhr-like helicase
MSKRGATDALSAFAPATRAWFANAFAAPTPVQERGWPHIARGEHALLLAPTGSGKTLAAFLACIDRLAEKPAGDAGVRVLYVSPLKALAYDVERNLRVPLAGIARAAEGLGTRMRSISVSTRTGDTPERQRRQLARDPGDILITTPESLYLLLASGARSILTSVETVIIDEIHALAPTKRGAHLMISLERLAELTGRDPQRIGLSATVSPPEDERQRAKERAASALDGRARREEIARFLVGARDGHARPVAIVDAGERPRLDLTIEVPVEDMENPPLSPRSLPAGRADERNPDERQGVWPAIHDRLLELVRAHASSIVFANSRRLCERLAQRLNELAGEELVRAHHGSIAREQRQQIEEQLKAGRLRGIVATSSLELGIDMGAVDLVVQVESPGGVARGLQRVGRAGHGVGRRSNARILPKFRGDLLETAVVARRMLDGEVEAIHVPRTPLDVLSQQIVAMVAERPRTVDELFALVTRAYPFAALTRELYHGVLDMLTGRYPSDAFAELRPRLIWDRARDVLEARRDARLLAVVNAGTIPDRGLYGVHLGAEGPRVGELDEEMVHELRVGETFLLGASTWRAVEITRDRVIVKPAPGEPGKMPFWRGEGPGRPIELGRALGAFIGKVGALADEDALVLLQDEYRLDPRAARNLLRYVREQAEETGTLPTDESITIERFRDELGDWRVCILSPFGARVHAPWALALEAQLGARAGHDVQSLWSDDGIVLRFAAGYDGAGDDEPPARANLIPDPDELEELLLAELPRSALFATHFRENAARALLLPRNRPGRRTPLWSQRLRAQTLLAAALQHPAFPIVLETYRECLHDVFDVPALTDLLRRVRRREVRVVEVETARASPFARSLAFAYVAAYLYEGDAPLAERKAQALTLDRNLLRELLGQEELRDLLEPQAIAEVEADLQALSPDRKARHADALHDLLRRIGDLASAEINARTAEDAKPMLETLTRSGRAIKVRIAGKERWIAIEDVARYRDALGVAPPPGVPLAFLEAQPEPLLALVARWTRTHGPFAADGSEPARRFGLQPAQVQPVLARLINDGKLLEGEFRPGGTGRELCDPDVLRLIRRDTLARLRNEVAPVDAAVLARFLIRWHGIGSTRTGLVRLREVIDQLEGLPLPFSELERAILPARVADFHPRMLDELGATGELVWVGRAPLGSDDGRVALYRREHVAALLAGEIADNPDLPSPRHREILEHLRTRGASFAPQLPGASERPDEVVSALWDLAWLGLVTNDTFAPLRALAAPRRRGPRFTFPAGGRWSAVSELAGAAPAETVRAHARALMLLERYGVVSREAVASEGLSGGFGAVAPVLRAMEEAGKIRRGHFVDGLQGAQFAHAAAVDRLRAARAPDEERPVVTLSAIDPANPYGALLPWIASSDAAESDGEPRGDAKRDDSRRADAKRDNGKRDNDKRDDTKRDDAKRDDAKRDDTKSDDGNRDDGKHDDGRGERARAGDARDGRARRTAGASVVLAHGEPVLFVERGGKKLRLLGRVDEALLDAALGELRRLAGTRRHRQLRIEEVDGIPALHSPHAALLERGGFRVEPGALVLSAEP